MTYAMEYTRLGSTRDYGARSPAAGWRGHGVTEAADALDAMIMAKRSIAKRRHPIVS
jgi:hypothetical protein